MKTLTVWEKDFSLIDELKIFKFAISVTKNWLLNNPNGKLAYRNV